MACYDAHLAAGHTLLYKIIKSGTISKDLSIVIDLSKSNQMMNPMIDIKKKVITTNHGYHSLVQALGINA